MKTILITALAAMSLAGSAFSQEEGRPEGRQQQRPTTREEQKRKLLERLHEMTPERLKVLRERWEQAKRDLTPEQRQLIRQRLERLAERRGEMSPEQLRERFKGLHRPGSEAPPRPGARPGNPERRGAFVPQPDAVRRGGDEVRRMAMQKHDEILNRIKNSNEELYNRLKDLPPDQFVDALRHHLAQGRHPGEGQPGREREGLRRPAQQPPEGAREGRPQHREPGQQRPPQRGDRRKDEKQGGSERRGGV